MYRNLINNNRSREIKVYDIGAEYVCFVSYILQTLIITYVILRCTIWLQM